MLNLKELKFSEVRDKSMLDLNQAVEIIDVAIEKLSEKYDLEFTGYENISEIEDIVGKEVIITLCEADNLTIQLGGWVEIDRRADNVENLRCWFNSILIIPELDIKFGGGYNNDYTVVEAEYDIINNEWSEFYKSSL